MSRFSILRIDHFDPAALGRRNRIIFAIYGVIPTLFITLFNLGNVWEIGVGIRLGISLPVLAIIYIILFEETKISCE